MTLNPGNIEGGGAVNAVPDLAILRFNVRVGNAEEQSWAERAMVEALADILRAKESGAAEESRPAPPPGLPPLAMFQVQDGLSLALHGGFTRPPKPSSGGMRRLQAAIEECGAMLGMPVAWQSSGGCCDGNNLAAFGLPNIDTLGVRGGHLHSDREYMIPDSLPERAELSALLLMRLARGEISWPQPSCG